MSPLLAHRRIVKLHDRVMAAGLAEDRAALMAGVDPRITATVPIGRTPGAQLLLDLTALNQITDPVAGDLPLDTFLRNAMALLGSRPEVAAIRQVFFCSLQKKTSNSCFRMTTIYQT
ncbi:MAG: hypothetical protein U0359_34950 [Byssovorax sp.]